MIKKILLGFAALIALALVAAAFQPDDFTVTRSAAINAPAATLHAYADDLHKWNEWSPWAKMDPDAKVTFEGPQNGVGAAMAWDGKKSGAGKMTITESQPAALVAYRLDFTRPMVSTATAAFTYKEESGVTTVTWTMNGKNSYMGKLIGLILNCDKMVGGQFEEGLANLKALAEPK